MCSDSITSRQNGDLCRWCERERERCWNEKGIESCTWDVKIQRVEPVFRERARREKEREREHSRTVYMEVMHGVVPIGRGVALRMFQLHPEREQPYWSFKDNKVARRVIERALLLAAYGVKT